MVKYNEQEENDPHDVAEHGQLDVADHVGSGAESAVWNWNICELYITKFGEMVYAASGRAELQSVRPMFGL